MSLLTINNAELLEIQKHIGVEILEDDQGGFFAEGLRTESLKCTKYSYEHMETLGATMYSAP